jgi:hypothetical protein
MSDCAGASSPIHGYGKVYNLGHRDLEQLFKGPVVVEEKVDGSQFAFMRRGDELHFRSRSAVVRRDAPGMFTAAVASVVARTHLLDDGWIYRGEYLAKPKHNTLSYDRTPRDHIVIWDVELPGQRYLDPDARVVAAERIGLESVPVMHRGEVSSVSEVLGFMECVSMLGGQKLEGLVFKNYGRYGSDGKIVKGKHVSEVFKEIHRESWKQANPSQGDIVQRIADQLRTPSRWDKAIQHLRERGELEQSPRDIGKLIAEVQGDVAEECEEFVKAELWRWAKKDIMRKATAGLPEWYKRRLLAAQFPEDTANAEAES